MKFQRFSNKSSEKLELEDSSDSVFDNEDQNLNNQNFNDFSDMLTLEGLRRNYNSCSNCGVSWYDHHITLDCRECGGYAMCRPCPTCNGQCGSIWTRDVQASRTSKHAEWHGTCTLSSQWNSRSLLEDLKTAADNSNANYHGSYHSIAPSIAQKSQGM